MCAVSAVLASGCLGSSARSVSQAPATGATSTSSAPVRLDRPLHLPRVPASGQCPRTSGGIRAKDVAIALGHGPVYPVLGMSAAPPSRGGVAGLRSDFRVLGWYLHKTLWAISPRYQGPVLIRGRRIDRSGRVRFGGSEATPRASVRTSRANLRQPSETARAWR